MRLNKKGQALVEFVLILPIVVLILLATIDIGKIIYTKNNLQSRLDEAIDLLKNDKSYEETAAHINKNISSKVFLNLVYEEDNFITVKVSSNVSIITPGMNAILGNPYQVVETRNVYYNDKKDE